MFLNRVRVLVAVLGVAAAGCGGSEPEGQSPQPPVLADAPGLETPSSDGLAPDLPDGAVEGGDASIDGSADGSLDVAADATADATADERAPQDGSTDEAADAVEAADAADVLDASVPEAAPEAAPEASDAVAEDAAWVDAGPCGVCHGSAANPAPPKDLKGHTQTTYPGVGAHQSHLASSTWHLPVSCDQCHPMPKIPSYDPAVPTHMSGAADIVWGPVAKQGAYDTSARRCSGTYCHGGTMLPDTPGASTTRAPDWIKVDGTQAKCGQACHSLPPGGYHSPSTSCPTCHGPVISQFDPLKPDAAVWANAALHVDGKIDLAGVVCTSCHGDSAKGTPAPPVGTHGETATSQRAVGAHAQHLAASTWHRDGQCADCHAVPSFMMHANGKVELTWGGTSVADGAKPVFDTSAVTCTGAYCHGASLLGPKAGGAVNRVPVWTKVDGTFDACGSTCHTMPPGGPHPVSTACAKCHGATIATFDPSNPSATTWADRTRHVNGIVDVKMNCALCHGDEGTSNPAPPLGTHGETATTQRAVGAHARHLGASPWHRAGQCVDCHLVPTSMTHTSGKVEITWSGPSVADGATPAFDTGSLTCTGAYCHGATLLGPKTGGVVNRSPVWTKVDGTYDACGATCHTNPPGGTHPASTACPKCHGTTIAAYDPANPSAAAWADTERHVNGSVDLKMTCASCHGDESKGTPAPPLGTHGETATTQRAVGAHAEHLAASTWHRDGQCADCHVVPTALVHSNGKVEIAWGGPSGADGAQPAWNAGAATCAGVYCHGSTLLGAKTGGTVNRTPLWTKVDGTYDACGATCHTNPPGSTHPTYADCSICHKPAIATFNAQTNQATWTDRTKHLNGVVDRAPYHDLTGWKLPKGTNTHHGRYWRTNSRRDEHNVRCSTCHSSHSNPGPVKVACWTSGCHTSSPCSVCH
jgi:predicted CxxxxCH...CXXCH cytochrome family protein